MKHPPPFKGGVGGVKTEIFHFRGGIMKHCQLQEQWEHMRTNNDKKRSSNVWLNYRRAAKNESAVDAEVSI